MFEFRFCKIQIENRRKIYLTKPYYGEENVNNQNSGMFVWKWIGNFNNYIVKDIRNNVMSDWYLMPF
jgi:hypothetical protein